MTGMIAVRLIVAIAVALLTTAALAASGRRPAPPGAFEGAPAEYTRFSTAELMRGFLALAFGSDLRIGVKPRGIRRFDHPIRARVILSGSVDRAAAMRRVLEEYAGKVPNLRLTVTATQPADIEVRLIDEKDFRSALHAAFGAKVARTFIRRTNPQCMTSVKSSTEGDILRSVSFIIVDKGDDGVSRLRLSRAAARLRPVQPRPAQSMDHAQPETHGGLPDGL